MQRFPAWFSTAIAAIAPQPIDPARIWAALARATLLAEPSAEFTGSTSDDQRRSWGDSRRLP
ncbi:hypothetical protein AMR42_14510 [Limnothrix sp. PR1529]|nr:hypothetical protein BCR12_05680 [Limnothrix sp. P13C2]PIB07328.1 hypothetical protein AMR42_14510 [Limnothrix sp. PR1529]